MPAPLWVGGAVCVKLVDKPWRGGAPWYPDAISASKETQSDEDAWGSHADMPGSTRNIAQTDRAGSTRRQHARTAPSSARAARRGNPSWYDAEGAREQYEDAHRGPAAADRGGEPEPSRVDARDRRRRQRSKERADRMFDRQFGADGGVPSEGSPRAAVYKGKMGPSHRKASRMQGGGSVAATASIPGAGAAGALAGAAAGAAREGASAIASRTSLTPRSLKIITVLACLVFACTFLYTPAQQYYQAQREYDRLTAEYASIESRNEALDVQNDILTSDAGIEDAVRQKFGYVKRGEETAIVTGLSEETTDSLRDSEHIEANVLSSSVKAPEEWYTPILDALFGVE